MKKHQPNTNTVASPFAAAISRNISKIIEEDNFSIQRSGGDLTPSSTDTHSSRVRNNMIVLPPRQRSWRRSPSPHSQGKVTPGTYPLDAQGPVENPLFRRMQIPPTNSSSFVVEEVNDQRRSMVEKVGMACLLTPQRQQPTPQFSLPWRPTWLIINPCRCNRPVEEILALPYLEDEGVIGSVEASSSHTERRSLLIIEDLQANGNDNSAFSGAKALPPYTTSPSGDGQRKEQAVPFHLLALPSKIYMPDIF